MPNFSTFYHGVLWAAIDSHGSVIIIIGKLTITMVVSQLRCLTPNNKKQKNNQQGFNRDFARHMSARSLIKNNLLNYNRDFARHMSARSLIRPTYVGSVPNKR